MREIIFGELMPEPEGVTCRVCNDRGYIVLDVLQVAGAKLRWQWADFGPGINDCPKCRTQSLTPDQRVQGAD